MIVREQTEKPVVLVFAGHDPGGGAGVQADIETIAAHGCHAATVVTALTVQDTRNVLMFEAVSPTLVLAQARALIADMPVAAIKIGMMGSAANAHAIATLLQSVMHKKKRAIPVVLDPVLAAGGGTALADETLQQVLLREIFPLATIATPNGPEARQLAPEADTLAACAQALLDHGCGHVLITGGHEPGPDIISRLYAAHREIACHSQPRLPGEFHGSGCTLASAIAALLAHGADIGNAVDAALAWTWHALEQARRPGQGQAIPDRSFWAGGAHRTRTP